MPKVKYYSDRSQLNFLFQCARCGDIVKELDNIGRLECRVVVKHPSVPLFISVKADHGDVFYSDIALVDNSLISLIETRPESILPGIYEYDTSAGSRVSGTKIRRTAVMTSLYSYE
jgi:hypothetical protein